MTSSGEAAELADALAGLRNGDFTRLEPLFAVREGAEPRIVQWHRAGWLRGEEDAVAEALTCACWLGCLEAAEYLLGVGVAAQGGAATGMDALHWAANRGQLGSVRLLLAWGARVATVNRYGGTVIDLVMWSAVHEPKADHAAILDVLCEAGARATVEVALTGRADVDEVIRRRYQ